MNIGFCFVLKIGECSLGVAKKHWGLEDGCPVSDTAFFFSLRNIEI